MGVKTADNYYRNSPLYSFFGSDLLKKVRLNDNRFNTKDWFSETVTKVGTEQNKKINDVSTFFINRAYFQLVERLYRDNKALFLQGGSNEVIKKVLFNINIIRDAAIDNYTSLNEEKATTILTNAIKIARQLDSAGIFQPNTISFVVDKLFNDSQFINFLSNDKSVIKSEYLDKVVEYCNLINTKEIADENLLWQDYFHEHENKDILYNKKLDGETNNQNRLIKLNGSDYIIEKCEVARNKKGYDDAGFRIVFQKSDNSSVSLKLFIKDNFTKPGYSGQFSSTETDFLESAKPNEDKVVAEKTVVLYNKNSSLIVKDQEQIRLFEKFMVKILKADNLYNMVKDPQFAKEFLFWSNFDIAVANRNKDNPTIADSDFNRLTIFSRNKDLIIAKCYDTLIKQSLFRTTTAADKNELTAQMFSLQNNGKEFRECVKEIMGSSRSLFSFSPDYENDNRFLRHNIQATYDPIENDIVFDAYTKECLERVKAVKELKSKHPSLLSTTEQNDIQVAILIDTTIPNNCLENALRIGKQIFNVANNQKDINALLVASAVKSSVIEGKNFLTNEEIVGIINRVKKENKLNQNHGLQKSDILKSFFKDATVLETHYLNNDDSSFNEQRGNNSSIKKQTQVTGQNNELLFKCKDHNDNDIDITFHTPKFKLKNLCDNQDNKDPKISKYYQKFFSQIINNDFGYSKDDIFLDDNKIQQFLYWSDYSCTFKKGHNHSEVTLYPFDGYIQFKNKVLVHIEEMLKRDSESIIEQENMMQDVLDSNNKSVSFLKNKIFQSVTFRTLPSFLQVKVIKLYNDIIMDKNTDNQKKVNLVSSLYKTFFKPGISALTSEQKLSLNKVYNFIYFDLNQNAYDDEDEYIQYCGFNSNKADILSYKEKHNSVPEAENEYMNYIRVFADETQGATDDFESRKAFRDDILPEIIVQEGTSVKQCKPTEWFSNVCKQELTNIAQYDNDNDGIFTTNVRKYYEAFQIVPPQFKIKGKELSVADNCNEKDKIKKTFINIAKDAQANKQFRKLYDDIAINVETFFNKDEKEVDNFIRFMKTIPIFNAKYAENSAGNSIYNNDGFSEDETHFIKDYNDNIIKKFLPSILNIYSTIKSITTDSIEDFFRTDDGRTILLSLQKVFLLASMKENCRNIPGANISILELLELAFKKLEPQSISECKKIIDVFTTLEVDTDAKFKGDDYTNQLGEGRLVLEESLNNTWTKGLKMVSNNLRNIILENTRLTRNGKALVGPNAFTAFEDKLKFINKILNNKDLGISSYNDFHQFLGCGYKFIMHYNQSDEEKEYDIDERKQHRNIGIHDITEVSLTASSKDIQNFSDPKLFYLLQCVAGERKIFSHSRRKATQITYDELEKIRQQIYKIEGFRDLTLNDILVFIKEDLKASIKDCAYKPEEIVKKLDEYIKKKKTKVKVACIKKSNTENAKLEVYEIELLDEIKTLLPNEQEKCIYVVQKLLSLGYIKNNIKDKPTENDIKYIKTYVKNLVSNTGIIEEFYNIFKEIEKLHTEDLLQYEDAVNDPEAKIASFKISDNIIKQFSGDIKSNGIGLLKRLDENFVFNKFATNELELEYIRKNILLNAIALKVEQGQRAIIDKFFEYIKTYNNNRVNNIRNTLKRQLTNDEKRIYIPKECAKIISLLMCFNYDQVKEGISKCEELVSSELNKDNDKKIFTNDSTPLSNSSIFKDDTKPYANPSVNAVQDNNKSDISNSVVNNNANNLQQSQSQRPDNSNLSQSLLNVNTNDSNSKSTSVTNKNGKNNNQNSFVEQMLSNLNKPIPTVQYNQSNDGLLGIVNNLANKPQASMQQSINSNSGASMMSINENNGMDVKQNSQSMLSALTKNNSRYINKYSNNLLTSQASMSNNNNIPQTYKNSPVEQVSSLFNIFNSGIQRRREPNNILYGSKRDNPNASFPNTSFANYYNNNYKSYRRTLAKSTRARDLVRLNMSSMRADIDKHA